MQKVKDKSVIKGASILGLGAFISKVLGAIYRIPLTNLLGGFGIGLYQMVFPVYALLLDFSGCAAPSGMSKIIASEKEKEQKGREILSVAIWFLSILGLVLSVLMAVFSKSLAKLQGNEDAYLAYIFLAPAVFFVALISCYRGYFQGLMNMTPTALSQILEQAVKLVLGIVAIKLLLPSIPKAVAGATFAITVSEVVALIYLRTKFAKNKHVFLSFNKTDKKQILNLLIKTTLPITLTGLILPLSQVIDSFLTVNILSRYSSSATALFGLFSGVALTVVNLPVSVCHGIATVAIPAVSKEKDINKQNKSAVKTIFLTLAVSLPCAVGCFIFAPAIIKILFSSLSGVERQTAINLLRVTSPCIVLLSILQTMNGVLIGKGRLYAPTFSLGVGVVIKIILEVLLLQNAKINIYGSGIALNACYFSACLINLTMIFKFKVKNAVKSTYRREYAS